MDSFGSRFQFILIASPLVIAPKSTFPYIKFCGDYVRINKLLNCPSGAIPNVRDIITKISGFSCFGEFDMTNGFHQIPIGPVTKARLSVSDVIPGNNNNNNKKTAVDELAMQETVY